MTARTVLTATLFAAIAVPALTTPALGTPALTLYPERIGAETARYYRGNAAVVLKTPYGTVEIRPMPVEKGQITFAVAVYNASGRPANFGTENITASLNGRLIAVPSAAQLADEAQRKARSARIGTALFAGALAGIASTAHSSGTYYRHVGGPHGGVTQAIHWENDTPGIVGATAAVAGGAMVIYGIDKKLDYTLDRIDGQVLQTTTVDPGSSFGGVIMLPTAKNAAYPAEIRLTVSFNGVPYPFAFRLTPAGVAVPPPFPATARADAIPYQPEQPPMAPAPSGYRGGQ